MKRQPLGTKYGFTLIELMIVITILGTFILTTNIFNYSPQTESEKADRMMISVGATVKTELQNISIGKMPKRNGQITALTRLDIGTGGITVKYFTGASATVPISTSTFSTPYFDGDSTYDIKSVTWTGGNNPSDAYVGSGILLITPTGITFSGSSANIGNNALLEIKVGYLTRSRKVILDRRTGKVTETKLY